MTGPRITELEGDTGLQLSDPIENAQVPLFTDSPVTPCPTSSSRIHFPTGTTVQITAGTLQIPKLPQIHIRTPEGEYFDTFDPTELSTRDVPGDKLFEVTSMPMVLYLRAEDTTLRRQEETIEFTFSTSTTVTIGCRLFHRSPEAEIQVPSDPAVAMQALSYFGTALKTRSPERSFPSLRGHPPAVSIGDEFEVPSTLERPSTEVQLRLPPAWNYIYPATPLAYYLGADVEPAEQPELVAGSQSYPLDSPDYETAVHRLLKRCVFLDCVVRTEGYYQVELDLRNKLAGVLAEHDVALQEWYSKPIHRLIQEYLSLPYDELSAVFPDWPYSVDIEPLAEHFELSPYVANKLAIVRCPTSKTQPAPANVDESLMQATTDFLRTPNTSDSPTPKTFVTQETPEVEHEWIGNGFPLSATKVVASSYRRRLDQPPSDRAISILIVCNDTEMLEEDIVGEYYGIHDLAQFEIEVKYGLSPEELADRLATPVDLIHYVGHIEQEGIQCPAADASRGTELLDVRELESVAAKAFVLNGCSSYEQGKALVERGSFGGVVTLADIPNSMGFNMGRSIARLLNGGMSLQSALNICHRYHMTRARYTAIGQSHLQLVQCLSGVPYLLHIEKQSEDWYRVGQENFPTQGYGMGVLVSPRLGGQSMNYVGFGEIEPFTASQSDLEETLNSQVVPVDVHGTLYWSDELDLDSVEWPEGSGADSGVTSVRDRRRGLSQE